MKLFLSINRLTIAIAVIILLFSSQSSANDVSQNNQPRFTKLDAQGANLPDDATSWSMVLDNKTKLIWEVKTADNTIHGTDKSFKTWERAEKDFLAELNKEKFGGFSDWRLPSLDEIQSIYKKGKTEPFINTKYFPNTTPGKYWAFDICGDGTVTTKRMRFAKKSNKKLDHRVRAVRGGESE